MTYITLQTMTQNTLHIYKTLNHGNTALPERKLTLHICGTYKKNYYLIMKNL